MVHMECGFRVIAGRKVVLYMYFGRQHAIYNIEIISYHYSNEMAETLSIKAGKHTKHERMKMS